MPSTLGIDEINDIMTQLEIDLKNSQEINFDIIIKTISKYINLLKKELNDK